MNRASVIECPESETAVIENSISKTSVSTNSVQSEQINPVECARELKEWGMYDRVVAAFKGGFTLGDEDIKRLDEGQLRFSFEGKIAGESLSEVYLVVTREGEWGTPPARDGDFWKMKLKRDGDGFLIGDQLFSTEEVTKIKQLLRDGYRSQQGIRLANALAPLRFPVG